MLMAWIDGIKNRIEPPEPMDKDLYDLPPEEKAAVKQVPGSLEEVLDTLEGDHQWQLEGGVFTQDMVDTGSSTSEAHEVATSKVGPTPLSSTCTTTCELSRPDRRTQRAGPLRERATVFRLAFTR